MASPTLKTRLSSKGQVIIPKEVRERHGWAPGTELVIEERGGTVTLRPAKPFPPTRPEDVRGCLKHHGRAYTVREMDEAVDQMFRDEWK